MSDADVRALERRVLSGDRSALPLLRRAWWRLGEPDSEGPWKFGATAITVTKRPTPETVADTVLGCRARTALRRLGVFPEASLITVSGLTRWELAGCKLVGPRVIAEVEDVLGLAGLRLSDRQRSGLVESDVHPRTALAARVEVTGR